MHVVAPAVIQPLCVWSTRAMEVGWAADGPGVAADWDVVAAVVMVDHGDAADALV